MYYPALKATKQEPTGACEMTVKRTRLCYWIARSAKSAVQTGNTNRVRFTERSRFDHIHTVYKHDCGGSCLVNLIYFFYNFAICFKVLMDLGEKCHLKKRDMIKMVIHKSQKNGACVIIARNLSALASHQIPKIVGCACAGNAGNVLHATAGKWSRHESRHVRYARAMMHAGIAN